MKQQQIQQLVERFLDAETTLAEEHELYTYFQRTDVPEALKPYQEMFRGYAELAPKKTKPLRTYLPHLVGIAASVALVLIIGSVLTTHAKTVCYTIEGGRRITDHAIVMSHVESTLSGIFTSEDLPDVEHQMERLLNSSQSDGTH